MSVHLLVKKTELVRKMHGESYIKFKILHPLFCLDATLNVKLRAPEKNVLGRLFGLKKKYDKKKWRMQNIMK